jgi:hypothetical protein
MTTVPFKRGAPLLAALALVASACGAATPSQAPASAATAPPATQAAGESQAPAPEARTLQLWRIFND